MLGVCDFDGAKLGTMLGVCDFDGATLGNRRGVCDFADFPSFPDFLRISSFPDFESFPSGSIVSSFAPPFASDVIVTALLDFPNISTSLTFKTSILAIVPTMRTVRRTINRFIRKGIIFGMITITLYYHFKESFVFCLGREKGTDRGLFICQGLDIQKNSLSFGHGLLLYLVKDW
jgi:hypothetical protein